MSRRLVANLGDRRRLPAQRIVDNCDPDDGAAIAKALKQTLASFRRLTPAEVARLRPLRIDVVTAQPGDTAARLAARMRGTEQRLALFRLLNGLALSDKIEPGRKYKIVVD